MLREMLTRLTVAISLCAVSALAQYDPGPGMPGSPGTPGSPGYTPPKSGYSSKTGIAIGAAAAAGVGIGYLALRNRGEMTGCVARSDNGELTFINEKDKTTYTVMNGGGARLTPGDRLKVKGKKVKQSSGEMALEVRDVKKDFGPCRQQSARVAPTPARP